MPHPGNISVNVGAQNFASLIQEGKFYIDKTYFIKEWWEHGSDVTLITRPRRFGKTLNLSMVECFFSNAYEGRSDLFEGLSIWNDKKYRSLQGTYPVIFLSLASVKTGKIESIKFAVKMIIRNVFDNFRYIMQSDLFNENDRNYYDSVTHQMPDEIAFSAISNLCIYLKKYFGKNVIILLDEYDTPMQEAHLAGSWSEAVDFFKSIFSDAFKTNRHLHRGLITGITRISQESIFSGLNHPEVITTTSSAYATAFGFTESEVFQALDAAGLGQEKQGVKHWYDGFTFGNVPDIYNPWSIANFINNHGEYDSYWADSSSNDLIDSLIRQSSPEVKINMETLLQGKAFEAEIDEQLVFHQLAENENAIWSLLLATGYLRIEKVVRKGRLLKKIYTLRLTNLEVESMFAKMIDGWFHHEETTYNNFIKALLLDDVDSMNEFMNKIALQSFSSFDTAKNASKGDDPERFYHGFVLGLMVGLEDRFTITSNRESGFGRYDVMLEPMDFERDYAYIIEFKVRKPREEKNLEETLSNALAQIEAKQYAASLTAKGIPGRRIRKYGFAFEGRKVLIGC